MEKHVLQWYDEDSRMEHELKEEGHKFRWTVSFLDRNGNRQSNNYGLVPGGVFVAVFDLLRLSRIATGEDK